MLSSTTSDNKKPLFLRVEEVRKRKDDDIAKIKTVLQSQQKDKEPEPTFKPDLSKTQPKNSSNRTLDKFFQDNEEWQKRTKDKYIKYHLNILTEEMKENTFRPQINKNSIKIVSQVFFIMNFFNSIIEKTR